MLTRYRSAAAGLCGLLVTGGLAWAAGSYSLLPIVGGAAFCASTVSGAGAPFGGATGQGQGSAGSVCAQTVPAGPPALTGNELIPADTVTAPGASPQTVTIPIRLLGAGPVQYNAPLTGASITVNPLSSTLVLDPAGTIAALTLVFPPATALIDGQSLEVSSSNTVTALTITPGSGTTIAQNPTAITVSTTTSYGYKFQYVAAVTKWIRLQ